MRAFCGMVPTVGARFRWGGGPDDSGPSGGEKNASPPRYPRHPRRSQPRRPGRCRGGRLLALGKEDEQCRARVVEVRG
jgi:hypothetical protein